MIKFTRFDENPFLGPRKEQSWEARATFNPCVVKTDQKFHLVYRAVSFPQDYQGAHVSVSSIGYAEGNDATHFNQRRQLIKPDQDWDKYGCEDPRVTFFHDKYYIFYTALSHYPFTAEGIKIGLATTKDFQSIHAKHLVTPFNSKAMALFPDKLGEKMAAILTVHTDRPPAKIALAFFDKPQQIWSEQYWVDWYANLNSHVIPLSRSPNDHLEIGAPPLKTPQGWLLIYSYIQNYFSGNRVFGIEAVLLDPINPFKIIGRTTQPLLVPEKEYELNGDVSNVIFPSGALLQEDKLFIYYGAADTTCCVAMGNLNELMNVLTPQPFTFIHSKTIPNGFQRYAQNPIITPRPEFAWEAKATFNPAAIYEAGKVHIIYRAMSADDTSVFGYAASSDGVHIDERLATPIYVPRGSFERKLHPGNSGCEDARITKMDDRFYLFYAAYDGYSPRVALSSISVDDFLHKNWDWEYPVVITPPGIPDKDACLLPKKIDGDYVVFHRVGKDICINRLKNLTFDKDQWLLRHGYLIKLSENKAHIHKVGIAAPPIETEYGWLLFYHWITVVGGIYQVGAALLALNDPAQVISKTEDPLFEPEMNYEKVGIVQNVVFPCGAVLLGGDVYLYYGGADQVIGVAKMKLEEIIKQLVRI